MTDAERLLAIEAWCERVHAGKPLAPFDRDALTRLA